MCPTEPREILRYAITSNWPKGADVGQWSGTEVKIDGEDLMIMKESDILGIIVEGKAVKAA